MECKILIRSLKDSAADSKLKLLKEGETYGVEKPGGEKRIHIGATTQESDYDSFFFPNGGDTVTLTVSKMDLIRYMKGAHDEYIEPQQRYRLPISNYYEERYQQTLEIPEDNFQICFEKNIDSRRYYLTRPSGNKLNKNYNYITNICLPLITNFVFIRIENNDGSFSFFLKPEFVTPERKINSQLPPSFELLPLQQIFYGAPGTGKSNTIKREVDDQGKFNYRTTFHPDSDYSTFVGCYKPKMKRSTITKDGVTTTEEKIIYSFEPQAFTNAYVQAWKKKDDVYLIIEEINRGNCAQIFGDLFQLLDRKNGESEYPVDADSALADYLQTALVDSERDDIPIKVKNGTKLKLPSNLYIWATMNTSDQSLFPIDSAFKRRWEWVYMPIKDHQDKGYKIEIDDTTYDWWGFLEKINSVINTVTNSEDKKLGYFFVKTDKKIDAKKFVGKVLFYLWNDVFKNYGFDNPIFNKEDKKKFSFSEFFQKDGSPETENIKKFLKNLDETIDKEKPFTEKKPDEAPSTTANDNPDLFANQE